MDAPSQEAITLSFKDARHLVEEHASKLHPRGKELTPLLSSVGLILAEPVFADRDFPPFKRAARDGYAVCSADLKSLPTILTVIGEIKAGSPHNPDLQVTKGLAVSIMTGAAAPEGADAVVMIEHTSRIGARIEVRKQVAAGENIASPGSEAKRGARLLVPGSRLDSAALAAAASVGKTHLLVYGKPRIAILPTGDELIDIGIPPGPTQIRNSNSYSLAAQVMAAGGEPVLLPIARDESARLQELIADGLEADLLLISGGVSMGQYDLVEAVLANFNAEFFFTAVKIQPGRPAVFGRVSNGAGVPSGEITLPKYFFGLPGNPVSTLVTFELFARPVIEALAGMLPGKLIFLHAKAKSEIKAKPGLTRFLPAIVSGEFDQAEVELAAWQGSGDIAAAARANCYLVIPPDREVTKPGEWVAVLQPYNQTF